MTKQDDFVNQPLQKKLNRQNILSRLERVESQSGIRPSARVGQLSDLTQAVGNLIVTGGITVVDSATGTPLLFIDSDGINIINVNSIGDPYLNFYNPNNTKLGSIRTSSLENLEITAFGYAVEAAHQKLVLRAQHDGGAVNVATIEIISNFDNTGVDWITLNADKINLAGDTLIDGDPIGWIMLEDINLTGGTQASFDFQSIPATFKHLKIELVGRSTRAAQVFDSVTLKANNDSGNNYFGYLQFRGGSSEQVSAGAPFSVTFVGAASTPANWQSNAEITLYNYASTNIYKTWQTRGMDFENSAAGGLWIYDGGGLWASTAAISRLTLTPSNGSWAQYSRATLYGMK
jgi:hypothetical protein